MEMLVSKAKDKGRRFENETAKILNNNDIKAERIPLSGSFGGKYDCDVVIGTPEDPEAKIECKNREDNPKKLWEWLDGNDFVALRRNNYKPLILMDMDMFIELWKAKHGKDNT